MSGEIITVNAAPLRTVFYGVDAGQLFKIYAETAADQVILNDGSNLETRLQNLGRQKNQSPVQFANNETALAAMSGQPGDLALALDTKKLFVRLPQGTWEALA